MMRDRKQSTDMKSYLKTVPRAVVVIGAALLALQLFVLDGRALRSLGKDGTNAGVSEHEVASHVQLDFSSFRH
jgi:hypothetical protein